MSSHPSSTDVHQPPCLSTHSLNLGHLTLHLSLSRTPCHHPRRRLQPQGWPSGTLASQSFISLFLISFSFILAPQPCHYYALGLCHHEELTICELLSSVVPAHTQLPSIIIARSRSRRGFNSFFREGDCMWVRNWTHVADKEANTISHYFVLKAMKLKNYMFHLCSMWNNEIQKPMSMNLDSLFKGKIICYKRRLSLEFSLWRPEVSNIWP